MELTPARSVKTRDEWRQWLEDNHEKEREIWLIDYKKRAKKMIREGKMTAAGLSKIEAAKKNGNRSAAYTSKKKLALPSDLKKALMENNLAGENFSSFANAYQNTYIGWVISAKREETRERRIKEVVRRALQNQKPGMM